MHERNSFNQHNNVRRPGVSHRGAGRKKKHLLMSLALMSSEAAILRPMAGSHSCHMFRRSLPSSGSMYFLFHQRNESIVVHPC